MECGLLCSADREETGRGGSGGLPRQRVGTMGIWGAPGEALCASCIDSLLN